ncbi:uncharacterized protein LOC108677085 [Hyalella azteca]|uniref:Uncharacterized protein LOC108677085 n=1 Tax=Hyalella azteca TaxID=294128 RepID=A0A8B7P3M8_HYAAZ|nr:uncharacterized protein LOC108677085 [Hyalella azteca]
MCIRDRCCVWLQHLYEGSTSCCSTLQRLCGSRKVVGTYNTLRNEDTSGDVATPPPAQLPNTATPTTVSTETSVSIDISPATTTTHFSGPDTVVFDATTMRPDRHNPTRLPDHIREKKLAQEALLRARTANFLAAIFFAVAFLVDYIALRVRLGS